jgi:hypothetical protein
MKVNTYVQYHGKEIQTADLEKRVKEIWRAEGHTIKEIESLALYFKVDENACYYVVNETFSGKVPIEG